MGATTSQAISAVLREVSDTPGWTCETQGHDSQVRIIPPAGVSRPFKIHLTPAGGFGSTRAQILTRLARHGWTPVHAAKARAAKRERRIAVHDQEAARVAQHIDAIDRDAEEMAATTRKANGTVTAKVTTFSDMPLSALARVEELEELPFSAERAVKSPRPPVFVKITPAWATRMITLDHDVRSADGTLNRKVSAKRVEDYMSDMRNKLWKKIHQGYALTAKGKIMDGQHRLLAVQATGATIYGWVFFDADESTFDVVDNVRPRTVADALHVGHEANTIALASLIRQYWMYNHYDEFEWAGLTKRLSATASRDILTRTPQLREALVLINRYGKLRRLMRPTPAALGVFLALRAYPAGLDQMHEFLQGAATGNDANGDGLRGTDPRKRLHTLMDGMRDAGKRRDNRFHLGVFLKAWNMYCEGRGANMLGLRIDERIPLPYAPEK